MPSDRPHSTPTRRDPVIAPSRAWLALAAALLAASTVLKLYHVTAPALDWHSWKQITTLAKARYIYRDGLISFFVPRVDLFTGLDVDSNKAFAEVPLLQLLMAIGYWLIGGEAEWVGRAWSIAFSILGGAYLARLVWGRLSPLAGGIALSIYALSPTNLFFYRTLITDVPMTFCLVIGVFYFVRWMEVGRPRDLGWCGVATAFAALFKVYALFIGVAYAWTIVRRRGWRELARPAHLALAAGSIAPIAAWLVYGYLYFPDKPGVGRNLNASTEFLGSWRLLLDPDYYSALWDRLGDYALTPLVGLLFLAAAVCAVWGAWRRRGAQARRDRAVGASREDPDGAGVLWSRPWPDWLVGWWLGIVVYLLVVRQGNREHDYYQMCLLPPLAIGAALGCEAWWRWLARWDRGPRGSYRTGASGSAWRSWGWAKWATLGLELIFVLYAESRAYGVQYAGIQVYGKYKLALDSYYAGKAIAAVRQDDEKTVFLELGGLRHQQLLYYSGGRGWFLPADARSFEDLRPYYERGARYLAIGMRKDEWEQGVYPAGFAEALATQGHLKELARSDAQTDRYDRPRRWVVYRLVE